MKRGEIRCYTFRLPDKRRPVLVLTRNDVIDRLNEIIVVPATRTIRGLTTEVVLTPDDGMPAACALNFDHVSLAQRNRIGAVLCSLPETLSPGVQRALLIACGGPPAEQLELGLFEAIGSLQDGNIEVKIERRENTSIRLGVNIKFGSSLAAAV